MSGKKQELIERVGLSIGRIKVDPKIDGGKWYELKKRNSVYCENTCLDVSVPQNGWKSFPSGNVPSMFNYAIVHSLWTCLLLFS